MIPDALLWAVAFTVGLGVFFLISVAICCNRAPAPALRLPRARDPDIIRMTVPADGREKFTPLLLRERVYRVEITGSYRFERQWFISREKLAGDGRYYTDSLKNFTGTKGYQGIRIDGVPASTLDSWTEDRATHRYSCLLEGTGQRIPLQLCLPQRAGTYAYDGAHLVVCMELQPVGTLMAGQQEEAALAEAQRLQRQQGEEQLRERVAAIEAAAAARAEEEREQEAKRQEEARVAGIRQRVGNLSAVVEHNRNLLDDDYCEQYVKRNLREILDKKKEWVKEYAALMADSELVVALKATAPDVLDWYHRRVDMVNWAERLDLMPSEPLPPLTPRPITARTRDQVAITISELFQLRDEIDQWTVQEKALGYHTRRVLTEDEKAEEEANHWWNTTHIEDNLRSIAARFELLKAYGIVATTPEQAEEKLSALCPPAGRVLTPNEELIQRINAQAQTRGQAGVHEVKGAVSDLQRQEKILQAKLFDAIRGEDHARRDYLKKELSVVRYQASIFREFLVGKDCSLDFLADREQDKESIVKKIAQWEQDKLNSHAVLPEGDTDAHKQVEDHFAELLANIFGTRTEESYT